MKKPASQSESECLLSPRSRPPSQGNMLLLHSTTDDIMYSVTVHGEYRPISHLCSPVLASESDDSPSGQLDSSAWVLDSPDQQHDYSGDASPCAVCESCSMGRCPTNSVFEAPSLTGAKLGRMEYAGSHFSGHPTLSFEQSRGYLEEGEERDAGDKPDAASQERSFHLLCMNSLSKSRRKIGTLFADLFAGTSAD
jgi:hypothetical protein